MTLSEERCPTCDGSGFVARDDQRSPCPTCSPTSSATAPYLAHNVADQSGALVVLRFAAYLIGAAAFVAALALVIKELWK